MTYEYIDGVERETAKLREFPVQFEKNIVRGALRAAATFIRKIVQPMVPIGRGHGGLHLAGTLRVSTAVRKGVARASVKIGNRAKGVFWSGMFLGGTKPHQITGKRGLSIGGTVRSSVRHPGAKANPVMAKADAEGRDGALKSAFEYADDRTRKLIAAQGNEPK